MASPSAAPPALKTYRVGTLGYTRAALVQVMFWMLLGVVFFQLLQMLPSTALPLQLRWAGASDTLIGFKSSLSSLVAFFWYPMVGARSDRHRGPLGRRRPFLLWSIPPLSLCIILLGASAPAGVLVHQVLSWLGLGEQVTSAGCTVGWILGVMVAFMLCNAFLVQAYGCLVADVIPPEVIGKFTGFYRALGALGSLAFTRWAFPWIEPTLGLSLDEFGKVKGWTFLVQIPVFLVVGSFVDRFHPVRVAVVGMFLECVSYLCCYWMIDDAASLLVWLCINQAAIAVYLGAYMALAPRLLPRSRYGQFIAANTVFGITSLIIAPLLVGELLTAIRDYRFIYLFCAFFTVMAMLANWTLFLQWRKRGGDTGFAPPETGVAPTPPPARIPA